MSDSGLVPPLGWCSTIRRESALKTAMIVSCEYLLWKSACVRDSLLLRRRVALNERAVAWMTAVEINLRVSAPPGPSLSPSLA